LVLILPLFSGKTTIWRLCDDKVFEDTIIYFEFISICIFKRGGRVVKKIPAYEREIPVGVLISQQKNITLLHTKWQWKSAV
jgi:hypothetical protein